jgi:tetratricopeptide (TPR) repeat protein
LAFLDDPAIIASMRYLGLWVLMLSASLELGHAPAQPSQQRPSPKLVTWFGPGAITLPTSPDWQLDFIDVYDNGQRPVFQYKNDKTVVTASFILFENHSGNPSAKGCRDDAINPILEHQRDSISQRVFDETEDGHGGKYARASYLTKLTGSANNRDLFLFSGDAKTCAEIHVSAIAGGPDVDARLAAALAEFRPNLVYQPDSYDYFMVASLLYKQTPMLAAPYYKSSLDAMPPGDPVFVTPKRIATDNLVMALGMSGDIKDSRTVAENAIRNDPGYPLNYYNLACADAEQGKAADAKLHLQQAFDRKANVLPGEHLPDPTTDDSILKLKNNKEFWAFVQTLK